MVESLSCSLKICQRVELDALLAKQGYEKGGEHGKDCYGLVQVQQSTLVIEDVDETNKPSVIRGLLRCLIQYESSWLLFPKLTYFGETPWYELDWKKLELPLLRNEGIRWDIDNLPAITTLITEHFQRAWNIGWDLYICSLGSNNLVFLGHHDYIVITSYEPERLTSLSKELAKAGIPHQIYPEPEI